MSSPADGLHRVNDPFLYRGALQPAWRSLGIAEIARGRERVAVRASRLAGSAFHRLVEFVPDDGADHPRILLVPPLSGHFPMLLRDLVLGLLGGFRVALLEWTNVRHVPRARGTLGLSGSVAAVEAAMRLLGPGHAVLGVCQGGVPALAATGRLGGGDAGPAALVLMATPVDPLANPTTVVRLLRQHAPIWYRAFALSTVPLGPAGRGRRVYAAETQFLALSAYLARRRGLGTEIDAKLDRDDGADPERFPFAELYSALMDIDAPQFLENIEEVFLARSLARNRLEIDGARLDFRRLRGVGLMTLEGGADDIAAPGQAEAAHGLCSGLAPSERRRLVLPGCGHFSLFHGTRCREEAVPEIRAFCAEAMARRATAPACPAGAVRS